MTTTVKTSDQRSNPPPAKLACPTCGKKARKVNRVTLDSLLRPERRNDIGEDQYYVCATPNCETVYFSASNSRTFRKPELTVRFGLKETDAPRHVCYCFDHTVEEIHDEIRRTGKSTVVESIKADMKEFGCRCEYTNPLGGCCLKTVQDAVADALRTHGNEERAVAACAVDYGDCCATQSEAHGVAATSSDCCNTQGDSSGGGFGRDRAGTLAAGGSVVAAIMSSACCWLPLVLIAFGASAAGVAGFFETYRPHLIVGAVGLLGLGYYMVYFRKERCAPHSACATPNRKLVRFNKVMLWTATALVGAFVMFPNYVGFVLRSPSPASAEVETSRLVSAEFKIEGMTCQGCSEIIRSALTGVPGVKAAEVDYATKTAVVHYEPGKPVSAERVMKAVKAAGYNATPAGENP